MNILQKIRANYQICIISLITLIICLFFAFNISPLLRGPNDPVFESHWPYYFVNTFSKLWVPILVGMLYILYYKYLSKRIEKISLKKEIMALFILSLIVFLFQLSLVFFSRFGITVLFRRIADSGINGYFTAAMNIGNIHDFFVNYPKLLITSLPQHARGDPPGGTLLMYFVLQLFKLFPQISNFLVNLLPKVISSQHLWNTLSNTQRVSAIFLGFFLHFLSAITVIPFYFLAKNLLNTKAALITAAIWGLIPSLTFFSLIYDPFYTLFPLVSFLIIVKGFKGNDTRYFFFSGLIFSVGLFFTPSILPILFFLILLLIFTKDISRLKIASAFILGLLIFPSLIMSLGYNSLVSGYDLLIDQTPRAYFDWIIYNPYDVFVFMGIPISLFFIPSIYYVLKKANNENLKKILIAFLATFALLVLSGISKGEAGRIWIPLMIIPVGFVGFYLSKQKQNYTYVILTLLIIQCIVMEEFWVPIW